MPTATAEDYLKQLYTEQHKALGKLVPMGQLAAAMGVVPGTATTMVKSLAESGWVAYEPRNGVRLTRSGERVALSVLRRHRLVEVFLVKVLGLDWAEVHEEAERLEHVISEKVLGKLDELLGNPTADPHGDPIPTADGRVSESNTVSLADCPMDTPVRIVRIADQDGEFLRFLERSRLTPGTTASVTERDTAAQALQVRVPDHPPISLGIAVAKRILVESARAADAPGT